MNVVGEVETARLSPLKKVSQREFNGESQITIGGVNCLDYMLSMSGRPGLTLDPSLQVLRFPQVYTTVMAHPSSSCLIL